MAMAPCDTCRRRYVGPASSYYFGMLNGSERTRWKLRLCPACRQDLDELLATGTILIGGDQDADAEEPKACLSCARETEGHTAALFCTTYRAGEDRRDYFGVLHDDDACTQGTLRLFKE